MLTEGIDKSLLITLDVIRIRKYIGVTLLSYSGILSIWINVIYHSYTFIFTYIVNMSERCILCEVGDESIDHQDYNDWVSTCLISLVLFSHA